MRNNILSIGIGRLIPGENALAALGCLFFLAWAATAFAREIVVVQDSPAAAYEEAYRGFESAAVSTVAAKGPKSIQPDSVTRLILNREDALETVAAVRSRNPDLIAVLGNKSLQLMAREVKDVPIVYLLAPEARTAVKGRANISGVDMAVSPAQQLGDFVAIIPSVKRIGVVYDPKKTGVLVEEARLFAVIKGVELVAVPVDSAREVSSALAGMKDKIDGYWLVPDTTVIMPETLQALFLFSFENRVPVLAFADKYLDSGATVVVSVDLRGMGVQAGEMARSILAGDEAKGMAVVEPARTARAWLNHKIAGKLGLRLDMAALQERGGG